MFATYPYLWLIHVCNLSMPGIDPCVWVIHVCGWFKPVSMTDPCLWLIRDCDWSMALTYPYLWLKHVHVTSCLWLIHAYGQSITMGDPWLWLIHVCDLSMIGTCLYLYLIHVCDLSKFVIDCWQEDGLVSTIKTLECWSTLNTLSSRCDSRERNLSLQKVFRKINSLFSCSKSALVYIDEKYILN